METRILNSVSIYGALVMSKDETEFPANPAIGTFLVKDRCLYGYINIGGLETWYPFANKTRTYVHVQAGGATTWYVNHNLGTTDVWFQVKDTNGNIVMVSKTDINENSFQLNFTSASTGTVIVVAPTDINVPQVKSQLLDVGNGAVIIDSSGVQVNGAYVLTSGNIGQQVASAVANELSGLSAVAFSGLYTDLLSTPQFGTAAEKDVAVSGNASTTQVVLGSDSRLTDARTPTSHIHTIGNITGLQASLDALESSANKGIAGGYASLDVSGKVPASQLPSYVDDVLEYANYNAMPSTGEAGKLYVTLDTNTTYRWSGTTYIEIAGSAGSTDAVPEGSTNLYFTNARAQAAVTSVTGNAGTATKLATARSIAMTGDISWSVASFDGSANVTSAATLSNSGVTAGTYIKVTVDAKGRVTSGSTLTSTDITSALGFTPAATDTGAVTTIGVNTTTTTANQVVDAVSTTVYRTVQYVVQVTSGTSYQTSTILMIHDGTSAYSTEYAIITTGATLATFNSDVSGGNMRLLVTPMNAVTSIKAVRTQVTV